MSFQTDVDKTPQFEGASESKSIWEPVKYVSVSGSFQKWYLQVSSYLQFEPRGSDFDNLFRVEFFLSDKMEFLRFPAIKDVDQWKWANPVSMTPDSLTLQVYGMENFAYLIDNQT